VPVDYPGPTRLHHQGAEERDTEKALDRQHDCQVALKVLAPQIATLLDREVAKVFVERGPDRIGREYIKALARFLPQDHKRVNQPAELWSQGRS
jgi:hypothetical protein